MSSPCWHDNAILRHSKPSPEVIAYRDAVGTINNGEVIMRVGRLSAVCLSCKDQYLEPFPDMGLVGMVCDALSLMRPTMVIVMRYNRAASSHSLS